MNAVANDFLSSVGHKRTYFEDVFALIMEVSGAQINIEPHLPS